MRKSNLERLREAKRAKFTSETVTSFDDLIALLVDGDRPRGERMTNPTQLAFIRDTNEIKAYKGPAGCAKTSTGVAEALLHGILEPGSKLFIARRDYNDLKGTTMLRAWEMVQRLPAGTLIDRNKEPPEKWWIKSIPRRLSDNTVLDTPSEITFIGMSDELKGSYEFNGGFVDEADECSEKAILGFLGRCRWMGHPLLRPHRYMSLSFNPPDVNHWLYTACTGKNAQGEVIDEKPKIKLFEPNARENQRNLPPDYYERMTERLPEDMRQRLVDGQWGSTFPGEAVVRQFKQTVHAKPALPYGGGTLFRFWDFGYVRPYCVWAQVKRNGQLQLMREFFGHHVEGAAFIKHVKALTSEHFPSASVFVDYGDPAVKQTKDTGSMLKLLQDGGIQMRYQRTPFDVSMTLLRKKFEELIDGEPAIVLSSAHCPVLKGALSGGYHFKDDGITPFKDGYYDHSVDALRYGVFNLFGLSSTLSVSSIPTSIAYWSNPK